MKRMLIGTLMAVIFAAVTAAQGGQQQQQQQQPPPPPQTQTQTQTAKAVEVTYVGCIVQGSTPKIFLFENALDPAVKEMKPRTFLVVIPDEKIVLTEHLNHKIQLVGVAETKVVAVPAPGTKIAEKDLPTFTIKTITHVADTCSGLGR